MSRVISAGAAAVGLFLAACATTLPETDTPGTLGTIAELKTQKAKAPVNLVRVYAPGAQSCTAAGMSPIRSKVAGEFDFDALVLKEETVTVECASTGGARYSRTVERVFDEKGWRTMRTAATVGAVLGGGPLGLISGPIAAEMQKKQYRYLPPLIHVVDTGSLDAAAKEAAFQDAASRWGGYYETHKTRCGKEAPKGVAPMSIGCNTETFGELRTKDLAHLR